MDDLNRFWFADDPDLLTPWKAASNVIRPPKADEKPARSGGTAVR